MSLKGKIYLIRKQFSHQLRTNKKLTQASLLFACSLSSKIIVYKGMLTPSQLFPFFPDLEQKSFETHLAMVHSRFSTNTFPSWEGHNQIDICVTTVRSIP
ncbi:MAG: hypothetical protein CM1200mP12_21840 [Gammaproteobacteria bacterium]|nr:MAG: hypothetical protein CM1200mP12_21840 [Gammaproteobacteria bacterium]